MNERDWERLERRLIDAHVGADPPLSRKIWQGIEAGLVVQPARRGLRLGMGIVVVVAAAAVALWFLPTEELVSTGGRARSGQPSSTIPPVPAGSDTARVSTSRMARRGSFSVSAPRHSLMNSSTSNTAPPPRGRSPCRTAIA